MKISLFKEFCVWVVPPGEARVRKFKITLGKVLCTGMIVGALACLVLFCTGDYVRVQLMLAKNEFWLHMVQRERDRLRDSEERLAQELTQLKQSSANIVAYEREIRSKIDAIASVLQSSTSIALNSDKKGSSKVIARDLAKEKLRPDLRAGSEQGGVGGLEVDCSTADCSEAGLADGARASFNPNSLEMGAFKVQGDLIKVLNAYLTLIQSLPLHMPNQGAVSSGFGLRSSPFHRGSIRMHEGTDFSGPIGSEVRVSGSGTVQSVTRNSTYGLYIDVRHTDRVVTRYAHLSKSLVVAGQKVQANQKIALMGSTGRSTGPHLHYEVIVDGQPKNPARFFSLAEKLNKIL